MTVNIYPIRLGIDNCYLLKGEGVIMIDGGMPNRANSFLKALERLSLKPDHIGLLGTYAWTLGSHRVGQGDQRADRGAYSHALCRQGPT